MQSFPTVLIPFHSKFAGRVEAQLDGMGNPPSAPLKRALDQLRTIHFMSISVVRGAVAQKDGPAGALLVMEVSADGAPRVALTQVAAALRGPLLDLLREAGVADQAADLPAFLVAHDCRIGQGWFTRTLGLCFCGTPGMTVRRIRQEAALAWQIARMRNTLASDQGALSKLAAIKAALWRQGDAKWAFIAEPLPDRDAASPVKGAVVRTTAAIMGTLLWPLALVLAVAWWQAWWLGVLATLAAIGLAAAGLARLRWLECTDIPDDSALDARHVSAVMAQENVCAQNLLVTVSDMKAGWLRRIALRAAFVAIGQFAAKEFRPGFLADIGGIHWARWVLVPGTAKLVFLSNYNGSLESYLEDFIQKASGGVTAIWSNTAGFPRARWLFLDGARDGDRLRRSVQRQQVVVRFWYSAYPSLTAARIRANATIRSGLASAMTEQAAEEWLACFGGSGSSVAAMPRRSVRAPVRASAAVGAFGGWMGNAPEAPRTRVEKERITVLAFDRRKRLRHSACLMIRLGHDAAKCRAWLKKLEPDVGYGPDGGREQGVVLAFAASAFDEGKLELPPEDLATFSPPFLNGMAEPCRARALGDEGPNAPENWWWGSKSKPAAVDVLVMAYSETFDRLQDYTDTLAREADAAGHVVVHRIRFSLLPRPGAAAIEPFGFVDGVSQPWIRGLSGEGPPPGEPPFEPGEFVLGYRDNSGYLPPTPTVAAQHDPADRLRPAAGAPGRRDLGRNGAYLAVRQLEQDTVGFADWLRRTAASVQGSSLASVPACVVQDLIGAKLIGRWRNGSALAQHPGSPGAGTRNDFRYGAADASGLGCPLGAHTRRANPRDSLDPGSDTQMRITNRHRILRVGRKYDAADNGGGKPGLLFMCLNADLGRQFEFIQQTWLLGRSFHGLEDEIDPLMGQGRRGARTFTVQTQQGPERLRAAKGLVTVRGGGYFFIPGNDALRYLADARPMAEPARSSRAREHAS